MYFDTLRRPDTEIEYIFSFLRKACKFWPNSLLLGTHVYFYTLVPRSSNLSQNFHAKLICPCEQLDLITPALYLFCFNC